MRALDGVTVIDLTHMLAGPYGAMLLADMGAETIKVEPPGRGEGTRAIYSKDPIYSVNGLGAYFLTLNRNKKSVCIDLKSADGLKLFYRLVEKADVVINNFSAGVPERLQIDYLRLSAINPQIITCSVTGFGESGPNSHRPAFDQVIQGLAGVMSITGEPGGPPLRAGVPVGDLAGGMFGAMAILSALIARGRTGAGQHIDISLLDCQISMLNYMATMFFLSNKNPEPLGNGHFVHVPYQSYRTTSDHIIIAIVTDAFWLNLLDVIQAPELHDNKYKTQPGRFANREFINVKLQSILITNSAEYWLNRLEEKRVPCARVNNFEQALSDEQIKFRNMVIDASLSDGKKVRMPGNPMKLSSTYEDTYTAPPRLGEHTAEILQGVLGLSDTEIKNLIDAKVVECR